MNQNARIRLKIIAQWISSAFLRVSPIKNHQCSCTSVSNDKLCLNLPNMTSGIELEMLLERDTCTCKGLL